MKKICPNCYTYAEPVTDSFCSRRCEQSYEELMNSFTYDRGNKEINEAVEVLDWVFKDMKEPVQTVHGITCKRS